MAARRERKTITIDDDPDDDAIVDGGKDEPIGITTNGIPVSDPELIFGSASDGGSSDSGDSGRLDKRSRAYRESVGRIGTGRRSSGRTKKEVQNTLDGIEELLFSCHSMLASFTSVEELEITEEEAAKLGKAIAKVSSFYDNIGIPPKWAAWGNLTFAAGKIYGPRVLAFKLRKENEAQEAHAKNKGLSLVPPTPTQSAHVPVARPQSPPVPAAIIDTTVTSRPLERASVLPNPSDIFGNLNSDSD